MRTHIGIFGRRNVGKSSLINALAGQAVSLVSTEPGTTTDPVKKALELPTLGPAILIDTAGLDDQGALGRARVERTGRVVERTDIGVVVAVGAAFGEIEERLIAEFESREVPAVVVFNKVDVALPDTSVTQRLRLKGIPVVLTAAARKAGVEALLLCLSGLGRPESSGRLLIADLVGDGGLAVLVIPIDKEAPRGRLILPQANALRELLDHGAAGVAVRDDRLAEALSRLASPPQLVVTDSQALARVAEVTPPSVPLTTFSILMSRLKGDPALQRAGALAIDRLADGSRVLIAESCAHHPTEDDIGRVKLPRWLAKRTGRRLHFEHAQGRDFPDDLGSFDLVVHCGACTWNRRQVMSRLARCEAAGVPVTNYGMAIAQCLGLLERALAPIEHTDGRAARTGAEEKSVAD